MKKYPILSLLLVGFGINCLDSYYTASLLPSSEEKCSHSLKEYRGKLILFNCPGYTIHPNGTQYGNDYYIILLPTVEEIKTNPKCVREFQLKLHDILRDCPRFTAADYREGIDLLNRFVKESEYDSTR